MWWILLGGLLQLSLLVDCHGFVVTLFDEWLETVAMLARLDRSSGDAVLWVVLKSIGNLVGAVPSFHTVGGVHGWLVGLVPGLLWSCCG